MGRFDTFRILIPGAVVTVLIYVVARILLWTPGATWSGAVAVVDFLESPLPAVVAAFAIGLVLYMIDPAYSSPEYFKDIPSEHLRSRLVERGVERADRISLSLYFLASDELMPTPLQDRALLYGALFRTGYQLTVYVLLAGAVAPWLVLLHPTVDSPVDGWSASGVLSVGLVAGAVALVLLIQMSRTRDVDRSSIRSWIESMPSETRKLFENQPEAWVVPLLAVVLAIGTALASRNHHLEVGHSSPLVVVLFGWFAVRFLGPVAPRLQRLREGSSNKPDSPFRSTCRLTLDLAPVVIGTAGMVAIAPVAAAAQLAAIGGLLVVGYMLSFARKVERQQNGIYRNQNTWLDLHLDELVVQAQTLRDLQQRPDE